MQDDPAGDEFIQDLALAGQEGTVADRMEGTAAYGRCRTKTGTISGVSNLSGYCFNRSGRVMAFSILMARRRQPQPRPPRPGPDRRRRRRLLSALARPASRRPASSRISVPNFSALASFEPGLSPATT